MALKISIYLLRVPKSGIVLLCPLLKVLQCQNQGVSLTKFSSRSTEKGSTTKIIQVLAKFIFLCV